MLTYIEVNPEIRRRMRGKGKLDHNRRKETILETETNIKDELTYSTITVEII